MNQSRFTVPPYPEDYTGRIRRTPEECRFGDGLPADEWGDRFHGMENLGEMMFFLFDPFNPTPGPELPPYVDYVFIFEERRMGNERKDFYIRADRAWMDTLAKEEAEGTDLPPLVERKLESVPWWGNVQFQPEHNLYLGRVPVMPGCFGTGATEAEAWTNLEAAAKKWDEEHPDWGTGDCTWERPIEDLAEILPDGE